MTEKHISTPIKSGDLEELRTGDLVYLSGTLVTGRDEVYQRIVRQGRPCPVALEGLAVFHAGPIVRKMPFSGQNEQKTPFSGPSMGGGSQLGPFSGPPVDSDAELSPPPAQWELISVGPTTSMRMESCQGEFLEATGAKLIVGKGGMGAKTAQACRKLGVIHTVYPGGCAALAAAQVEAVEAVHWLDLSMGEAMWVLRVRDFGPLVVTIDTEGNNLFDENKRFFEEKKGTAVETLLPYLRFME